MEFKIQILLTYLFGIISAVSLTFIVTKSRLFKPLRNASLIIHKNLHYLFSCPQCFGFWAGIIVSIFLKNSKTLYFAQFNFWDAIYLALCSSIVAYITYLKYKDKIDNE